MKIFTETDRLILREIIDEDEKGLLELDSDADVHRYLGNEPVKTIEQVRDVIKFIRRQYIDNGIGRWALIEKSSGKFIGWAGLKLVKEKTNKHVNFYDLGYRLIKKHWGKGFATEAAKACINYGFDHLRLNTIYAMADSENKNSINVLEKSGLNFIETFDMDGVPHNWFMIENNSAL